MAMVRGLGLLAGQVSKELVYDQISYRKNVPIF